MKDLFEHYNEQPEELKVIVNKWLDKFIVSGFDYSDCANFQKEVEKIGYTFDYELSAEPFNLRKMDYEKHDDDFLGELYGDFDEEDINEPF